MKCTCYCTAIKYQLKNLQTFLKEKFATKYYRDALHVKNVGDIFYFSYGCLICWDVSEEIEKEMLNYVKAYEQESMHPVTYESFNYVVGETTSITLEKDLIMIETANPLVMLALSFALTQSIKLVAYEESVDKTIKVTEIIPQELARKEKISLSRKQISKQLGQLFLVRSSINLSVDFSEASDYFCESPSLEPYYIKMANYLEIQNESKF